MNEMILGASEFVVRSQRVLLHPQSSPQFASIHIRHEKIEGVYSERELPSALHALPVFDFKEKVISPGIVDTHAHINEPGRTDWEGFQTATRAAAAGGITTVVDMPLNSIPPTTTTMNLSEKLGAATGRCSIDFGLWGGVVPDNLADLRGLAEGGVRGCKAFLVESGVEEFPQVNEEQLRAAMIELKLLGLPLLAHAELDQGPAQEISQTEPHEYQSYLNSRPPSWECSAIQLLIRLCRETQCAVHIVHLSTAEALDDIRAAKKEGLPFTVETCPHYLAFCAEEIPEGATEYKCAPPIREKSNQDRLWKALIDGTIDLIVSDHSPCTPHLKLMDVGHFEKAWGGIAGLQFSFSVIWTEMKKRNIPLERILEWMCEGPARLAGLDSQKGKLEKGADADLMVWDPDQSFEVREEEILHRHAVTPYRGRVLFGKVEHTLLRGQWIYRDGEFLSSRPFGKYLVGES